MRAAASSLARTAGSASAVAAAGARAGARPIPYGLGLGRGASAASASAGVLSAGARPASTSSSSSRRRPTPQRAAPPLRTLATAAASASPAESADITIVGGGVAGLALACALTAPASPLSSLHTPPSITLIDAGNLDRLASWPPASSPASASASGLASNSSSSSSSRSDATAWENRTVSLSADNLAWLLSDAMADNGSSSGASGIRHFLRRDRTWDVHAMTVSDGVTGATIEFGTDEPGLADTPHLSSMVELSNLQQALLKTLRQRAEGGHARVTILQNTKVQDISPSPAADEHENNPDPWPVLTLASNTTQQPQLLRTRLLIGADGHGSPVRKYAGIRTFGHDYNQRGMVSTLRCRPGTVGRTAYQRFLPSGPIAFLPMSDSAASMVWSLPPDMARALEALQRETCTSSSSSASDLPGELLAHLINAAFRLPWHSIDYLFSRIREFVAASRAPDPAAASGTGAAGRDWSWLQEAIDQRIRATLFRPAADVEASGGVPDEEYSASVGSGSAGSHASRAPPKVISVDARSTASFPLMLRHAEAYTGASLRTASEAANVSLLDTFKPSRVLEGLMGAAGLMRGVDSSSPSMSTTTGGLTHPHADGHSSPPARSRTVLVGDAAHTVHPLAGQGLNQGLLDVRSLAHALGQAVWEEGADLGLAKSLQHVYERERWGANALWASGIDKLGGLFAVGDAGRGYSASTDKVEGEPGVARLGRGLVERVLVWARSTGLEVLNELGPVKERMVRGAGSPSEAQRR
ncbi:putative ubiquinone biosynthesis monooxygenase [Tilletia horrida]|nr:putative ubiquinone biosynthesis monooxygenase [Tilletia horrida]